MTLALTRTKAEQALLDEFERTAPALAGGARVAELRRQAIGAFATTGLPHRRIEQWKYTDLRERLSALPSIAAARGAAVPSPAELDAALGPLAAVEADRIVLVDGRLVPALSAARLDGATLASLAATLDEGPAALAAEGAADAVGQLNLALMTDGVVLAFRAGHARQRPILVVHARASAGAATTAVRHLVTVEAGAEATLIEAHVALAGAADKGVGTSVTQLDLGAGASVAHVKCIGPGVEATHLSDWRVTIGKGAVYRGFQLTAGVPLARNETRVMFSGEDAKLDLSGIFLGQGRDHIDTTLVVEHTTERCESRELFKGVLDGRARGVFQGKIIVRPEAQKTDGKQMAQALMLSEDAEFDSKPELEIYADDVACGHGSTSAEIDPDLLFYLRSRGIPKAQARRMLIESFVVEALEKIEAEPVREALRSVALAWLDSDLGPSTTTSEAAA